MLNGKLSNGRFINAESDIDSVYASIRKSENASALHDELSIHFPAQDVYRVTHALMQESCDMRKVDTPLFQMVRELVDMQLVIKTVTDDENRIENLRIEFGAMMRAIAYTVGGDYHAGYDEPRAQAWYAVCDSIREAVSMACSGLDASNVVASHRGQIHWSAYWQIITVMSEINR